MKSQSDIIAERAAMPVLGQGTFTRGGKLLTLPIVEMTSIYVTMRTDDYGLITLNKKFVEVDKT